jgi:hypothetical protein
MASISLMVDAAVFTSRDRGADSFASMSGLAKNVHGNPITMHGPGTSRRPDFADSDDPAGTGYRRFRDEASVAS